MEYGSNTTAEYETELTQTQLEAICLQWNRKIVGQIISYTWPVKIRDDQKYSLRSQGKTFPNPSVGCVIVDFNKSIFHTMVKNTKICTKSLFHL